MQNFNLRICNIFNLGFVKFYLRFCKTFISEFAKFSCENLPNFHFRVCKIFNSGFAKFSFETLRNFHFRICKVFIWESAKFSVEVFQNIHLRFYKIFISEFAKFSFEGLLDYIKRTVICKFQNLLGSIFRATATWCKFSRLVNLVYWISCGEKETHIGCQQNPDRDVDVDQHGLMDFHVTTVQAVEWNNYVRLQIVSIKKFA